MALYKSCIIIIIIIIIIKEYRTRNFQVTVRFSPRVIGKQPWAIAHLMCAHINSTSYPQRDEKWVVAHGLRGEGLVWLIGAVVCLLAANRESNCSLTRAMDGRIVHCGIISSCQSAATTSEIVKRFWSRTHVRSGITSTFTSPQISSSHRIS